MESNEERPEGWQKFNRKQKRQWLREHGLLPQQVPLGGLSVERGRDVAEAPVTVLQPPLFTMAETNPLASPPVEVAETASRPHKDWKRRTGVPVFIIGTFLAVASIKGSDPWIVFPMLLLSWVASIWLIIILRSPLGLRLFGELLFTGVLVWVGVRVWPKPLPTPVLLTALYIGCEWDHIPITIEPGSSINVMWLSPVLLKGNPAIPFVGPFDTIRIPVGGKKLAWPAKSEGRMMTHAEMQENIKAKIMPTPYAFRCTLNNYAVTLDEIAAPLIIDTSDGKRHTYNIQFSPSVLGHPFEFYMVNKCSSGVVPTMVQWGNAALARIIGDAVIRRIPLQFERKAWPSNLIPLLGASWFIWNDTKDGCKWD